MAEAEVRRNWRLGSLPLSLAAFTTACFVTTYAWSASAGTLHGAPFLSATIDHSPVSNFGSLFLALCSVLLCCVGLLRWKLMLAHHVHHQRCLVHSSLVCCVASAFFLTGVGAFQYHFSHVVHLLMALMFFLSVNVYLVLMLRLDWLTPLVSRRLLVFRLVCLILSVVTMVLTVAFIAQPLRIDKEISAANEIAMVILFLIHVSTYAAELSRAKLQFSVEPLSDLSAFAMV